MLCNFENLTFQVLSAGVFSHNDGTFSVPGRPYAALSYRSEGEAEFFIGDESFKTTPGDISFIPAFSEYRVSYKKSESIVIHLTDVNYTSAENLSLNAGTLFYEKFKTLSDGWSTSPRVNGAKSVIYDILQTAADLNSGVSDPEFKKCISFISENYTDPELSVGAVCRAGNMSVATLRRKFMLFYESSPNKYITGLRLSRAVGLLIRSDLSVRQIASQCGFSDEKYFSRTVKKHYGVSPSSLRSEKAREAFLEKD